MAGDPMGSSVATSLAGGPRPALMVASHAAAVVGAALVLWAGERALGLLVQWLRPLTHCPEAARVPDDCRLAVVGPVHTPRSFDRVFGLRLRGPPGPWSACSPA